MDLAAALWQGEESGSLMCVPGIPRRVPNSALRPPRSLCILGYWGCQREAQGKGDDAKE